MEHSGSLPPPLFSVSLGPSVSLSLCSLLSLPLSFSPQSLREQSLGHEFWGEGASSLAWHSNVLCPLLPRVAMDKRLCPSGSSVFIFEMGQV